MATQPWTPWKRCSATSRGRATKLMTLSGQRVLAETEKSEETMCPTCLKTEPDTVVRCGQCHDAVCLDCGEKFQACEICDKKVCYGCVATKDDSGYIICSGCIEESIELRRQVIELHRAIRIAVDHCVNDNVGAAQGRLEFLQLKYKF